MEPIDADALLDKECCGRISGNDVRNAPTLKPDDCRPHGRWIERKYEWFLYRCNLCRGGCDCESNYCPDCGAKMDGKENE